MSPKRQLLPAAVLAATTLVVACYGRAAEPAEPAGESVSGGGTAVPALQDGLPCFDPLKSPILLAAVFASAHWS